MKTLVVEDIEIAREGLVSMLSSYQDIKLIGQAATVDEAHKLIQLHQPELIFLDIHLPGESAFDLLKKLTYAPKLIFTTAYSEYALQAFDHNTIDYLLKPITDERLRVAISKLNSQSVAESSSDTDTELKTKLLPESKIYIKDGEAHHMISLKEIQLFESCKNHTRLYFNGCKPFVHRALSHVEARLPEELFFRASRNHIVNLSHIQRISGSHTSGFILTLSPGLHVEVSRRQSILLKKLLSL